MQHYTNAGVGGCNIGVTSDEDREWVEGWERRRSCTIVPGDTTATTWVGPSGTGDNGAVVWGEYS